MAAERFPLTAAIPGATDHNQPTGQFYHVALDDQFPFHVFGASQDEGAYEGPSAAVGAGIGPGEWHAVALGESTFVAPDPGDPLRNLRQRLLQLVRAQFNRNTGNDEERQPVAALYGRRVGGRNEVSLRLDASDLLLAGRIRTNCWSRRKSSSPAWTAGRRGRSSAPISRATIRLPKARRGGPVTTRPNRCRNLSRHLVACGFATRWRRALGGLGRRSRARHDRSRRALEARNAAAASAVGADQLDRTVAYSKGHGLSHRVALQWDDYHPYVLRNDRLRRALDGVDQRHSGRPVRVRRTPRSERAELALCRNAQHGVRELQRRRAMAAPHAESPGRAGPRLGDRRSRRRARRSDARARLLDSR